MFVNSNFGPTKLHDRIKKIIRLYKIEIHVSFATRYGLTAIDTSLLAG